MIKNIILTIILVFSFSCSKTEPPKEESNQSASSTELEKVVLNYANIVHASYVDSLNLAKNMQETINAFMESPSAESLEKAK